MLKKQQTALSSLDKASKIYISQTTVSDSSYNSAFIKMTLKLDEKLDSLLELYAKIC